MNPPATLGTRCRRKSAPDRYNKALNKTSNKEAEALVATGTDAVITLRPDVVELVPSEALPPQSIGDPASVPSFPKVLRRRRAKFIKPLNRRAANWECSLPVMARLSLIA